MPSKDVLSGDTPQLLMMSEREELVGESGGVGGGGGVKPSIFLGSAVARVLREASECHDLELLHAQQPAQHWHCKNASAVRPELTYGHFGAQAQGAG